jgi:two-component system sensor histidine kinase MtrB
VKLGIGARITAVFGLGALILSILMGGLSYFTVRHFLLAGRESTDQHQAFTNASLVRTSLETGDTGYVVLLSNIDAGTDAHSVLYHRAKTYDSSLAVTAASIPRELRKVVLSGTAATQTYRNPQGTAEIVIGVPIPSVHADYFDVFDLSDLDHTLRVLALALFAAGGITTIFGIALGRFASTRSLRPLAVVSRAAGAIAAGDLDTRLDLEAADPDLEGFTLSFNAMVDQLQERIEREARFNSDVSHELRSPLTTLAAAMEVLEADREALPPRSKRALQLLSDDLRRFQRWWATCSRCRGPRPARSTSSSRRCRSPSWCSARSRQGSGIWWRGAPGGEVHPTSTSIPPCAPGGWASTSAASNGSWSTSWRTQTTTAAA